MQLTDILQQVGGLQSMARELGVTEQQAAVGAEALNPWFGLADADWIEAAHADGRAVYPYTVDALADMRSCLEAGVDGLFTNHPERLRALLDASLSRHPALV